MLCTRVISPQFSDRDKQIGDHEKKSAPKYVIKHPGPKLVDETTRWSKCKPEQNMTIYDFEVETLDGKFNNLEQYKGQIVLLINVATFCAFTQQYLDFNPFLEHNHANGVKLAILAFPCNQFHLQEPAENHEILNGVMHVRPGDGWKPHANLHIHGKLEVNGANAHPMYDFLRDACPQTVTMLGIKESMFYNPITVNDITWNFEKFLIDADGIPRYRFHPTNWSHGKEVQKYINLLVAEQQLAKKA
uniref:Glutathione peroxidase n=1 Tax=Globodera rostochiensis TaxID=31243 RepID=A0A914IG26_GLORO